MAQAATIFQGPLAQDILPIIFKDLYRGSMRRSELIHAGLTCKACFGPAMDILWHWLDSPNPVLCLLPVSCEDGKSFVLESDLSPEHFERLDLYRRRVRSIALGERDMAHKFSLEICTALNALLKGGCLFPRLLEMFLYVSGEAHMPIVLPLFLCSSLRRLAISGQAKSPSPLLLASRFAPGLTELDLYRYFDPSDSRSPGQLSPKLILTQIMAFRFLRTLRLATDISETTEIGSSVLYKLLESLPLLKDLTVEWIVPVGGDAIRWEGEATTCPKLESFVLYYAPFHPENSDEIYFELQPLPLIEFITALHINLPYDVSADSLSRFMSGASRHRLREFTIEGRQEDFDLSIFLPVLSSKHLRAFRVSGDLNLLHATPGDSTSHFSNLIIHAMDHNCQSATQHSLLSLEFRTRITPTPTLQDLRMLAQKLPNLQTLCMPLDLVDCAILHPSPLEEGPFENTLMRFEFYNPDVLLGLALTEEPLAQFPLHPVEYLPLARCLNAWFPNLQSTFSKAHIDQWGLVEEMRMMNRENELLKKRLEKYV